LIWSSIFGSKLRSGFDGKIPYVPPKAPDEVRSDAVQADIKTTLALGIATQVDPGINRAAWIGYIARASSKAKGYERLMKDLNCCLEGSKRLTYTPDGVPAFVEVN